MESMQHNNESPLGTTTGIVDNAVASSINGRKGPSYDWQSALVPSDTVFEASLQMMLAAAPVTTRARKSRRRS